MNQELKLYLEKVESHDYQGSKLTTTHFHVFRSPYPIKPVKGKHSLDSCKGCKETYQYLINDLKARVADFPNCCESHKRLLKLQGFDKAKFQDIEIQLANKIMFCYHHFVNHLDDENWLIESTDYYEYFLDSFGSMPKGHGEPFKRGFAINAIIKLLTGYLDDYEGELTNVEVNTRVNRIIEIVERSTKQIDSEPFNVNTLTKTYEDWLKVFPFELSIFSHLEDKFKKIFPLFTGEKRYNKYLKIEFQIAHSKESLSSALFQITQTILKSLNALNQFERDELSEPEKKSLELIISQRRVELEEISLYKTGSRPEYIRLLKKWFKGEKRFINEITPILEEAEKKAKSNRPNRTDIAYLVYYLDQTKQLKTKNPFPSEKAWQEIGEEHGKNWKNIQIIYNEISPNVDHRLQESRKKNLTYVLDNLLEGFPKAKALLEDELKKVF